MTADGDAAWLVDASYAAGQASLRFIKVGDLEPIRWIDQFQPYYLTEDEQRGEPVRKLNLFTQNELTLYKANYAKKPPKEVRAWELEIDPALSYIYGKRLRFGVVHRLKGNHWMPQVSLDAEQSSKEEDELLEYRPLRSRMRLHFWICEVWQHKSFFLRECK